MRTTKTLTESRSRRKKEKKKIAESCKRGIKRRTNTAKKRDDVKPEYDGAKTRRERKSKSTIR